MPNVHSAAAAWNFHHIAAAHQRPPVQMYLTKSLMKVAGMEPLVLDLALDLVL